MTINVMKNGGYTEPYNPIKLKKFISWMCEGIPGINPIILESKLDGIMQDGISTKTIVENAIYHANSLASYEEPGWAYAAGRGATMLRWKETGSYDVDFFDFVQDMISRGFYEPNLINMYSEHEFHLFDFLINQDLDLQHSYTSVINAEHKYLNPGECIQQMHMLNAMCIAGVERKYDSRVELGIYVQEYYKELSSRNISLATPWLSNLRNGGNISSCFIYKIDDTTESIAENFKRAIFTSSAGGGMGIDVSRVRAAGSEVHGRPDSSKGVVYTIKVLNDIAIYFDQGGKRAGAITVHCPAWHKDIEAFLEIQDENKDPRTQSFDVFMQFGANDMFMEAVGDLEDKNGYSEWYTFCPYEIRTVLGYEIDRCFNDDFRQVYAEAVQAYKDGLLKNVGYYENARDLMKLAIRKLAERGTPYFAFLDTINRHNPNKHEGVIPCVNLCTESFSNVMEDTYAHTCNLASIVAGRMRSFEDFRQKAKTTVRILSNGLDLTDNPTNISAEHNNRYRTIGVGVMGLHDWLVYNDSNYEDYDLITKTFEYVQYGAIEESIKLAKERGAYPAFKGSDWDNGNMIRKFAEKSVSPELDWFRLQKLIDKYGIFNSQLTSPAPNTSTALFMDSAAGVMPVYSAFYYDDNAVGITPVPAMYLYEKPLAYARNQTAYDQAVLVRGVGRIQWFTDTGVSAEYIWDRGDPRFNAKTIASTLYLAWRVGTKATYYIRTHKKDIACEGCAG